MRSGESVEPSARVIQVELPYPVTKKPRATNQACVFSMCTQRHLVQKGGRQKAQGALTLLALETPNALAKARANETGCARRKRALLEWRRAARDAGNRIKKRRFAPQFSFDYAALAALISGREPTARNLTKDTMGYQKANAAPDYVTLICVK